MYLVVRNALLRFDIDFIKHYKPEASEKPSPSAKVFASKEIITDYALCDETHVVILLNRI